MKSPQSPVVRKLDDNDIRSILARNHVGRLVFALGEEVDVRPLNYVVAGKGIYGRTSPTSQSAGGPGYAGRVAFEVDEIESVFKWKSVIVKGGYSVLTPEGPEAAEWAKATELMRRVVKQAFTGDDPAPERNLVFKIEMEEVSGRASG